MSQGLSGVTDVYDFGKKKGHSEYSGRIFVGYPLDQPLCYKVFLSGLPPEVKVSTHIAFVHFECVTSLLLQGGTCKSIITESLMVCSFDEASVRDAQFDTSALQPEVGSSNDLVSRLSDSQFQY